MDYAKAAQFIRIIRKYSKIPKLTPEIMHEFIEKIVEYALDKSNGSRLTSASAFMFRQQRLPLTVWFTTKRKVA